ncbi:MAG: metallopeptidase [Candidatus Aenigmarchaeota archaeon]|nr:metallopeptidase [Candidatus Aenigmarchaeota archaeon]
MIRYERDEALELRVRGIAQKLQLRHDMTRIACIRSTGSKARRTLARCHALPRVMQLALGVKAHYAIEVIAEQFDRLPPDEQAKTVIHELMHIPERMKGGFRQHDYVCRKNVEKMYKEFLK